MIWNHIKTALLLATLSSIILIMGMLFGGMHGLHIAFFIALAMNAIAYFFSDKIVLSMYKAQPLNHQEHALIYAMVHELATTMLIPMPKLWLVRSSMANAFATGRNPKHASVALTTGIIALLDQDELRGVLAHELSHIKNRDILVSTIAATLATTIGYLANMLQHAALWGSLNSDRKKTANPIALLLVAILTPLAATLIQLSISRSREFMADESGAHHTKEPLALASALEKLHGHIPYNHMEYTPSRATTAPLFIVHPFNGGGWLSIFSTHPPAPERIRRLREFAHKMF